MDSEHPSGDNSDASAGAKRSGRFRLTLTLGAAAALFTAAALLWWTPWDAGPECVEDEAHIVDDEAGLCYAIPEGWEPTSSERLGESYTSGAVPESTDDSSWIGAIKVADLDGGSVDGDDPEAAARTIAESLATTYEGDEPEVVSRRWELGRHEAATATAAGDMFPVTIQVTVVELEDAPVALISSTIGRFIDGNEVLDPVHETLALA
jgi:hypothetical protein